MAEAPTDDERRAWHRRFAVDANNRAWALVEQAELAPSDREELLRAAYASAHHWGQVGTSQQHALAALLLAIAHARLGHADLARHHATAGSAYFDGRASEPWERAFAHAAMAAAASVAGDTEGHAKHYRLAREIGATLDVEDRTIFSATFCRIPAP
jgi:hypothetical protein